ncbi:putative membrane protein [Pontibacter aydingkolensis]|uniref:DUF2231 domain-containing protein n=1 Tax=Pontibacter aydingkolensis TaxID=1911536 RepID=A0ABS7CZ01_9BACT|nr:hypothetical protein [Pontibacter aydingkolensis]MBW7468747.1 hypothetical protein [Pontibacter aydingkolensis]
MYLTNIFRYGITLVAFVQLATATPSLAHGNEKHGKSKTEKIEKTEALAVEQDTTQIAQQQTVTTEEHAAHLQDPSTVHATLADFPNKHPLIVHFPIVLLLVAAAVALCNIFFLRKELDWVVTIATLIGFVAAFVATKYAHPHTTGLTDHAQLVLDQHDLYADWTVYLGGFGLAAQLISQFLFKGRRWSVLVAALVLTGAAYAVAMAGHYGAQLVHIEGVGPQGRYLETEHHH